MWRLLCNAGILVSIWLSPAWVTLLAMAVMLFVVRASCVEVIMWGFVLDLLFGVYLHDFPFVPIFYTLVAGLMYFVMELLKPHLVFYES